MNIQRRNSLFVIVIFLLTMVLAACEMPSPSISDDVQSVPESGEVADEGQPVDDAAAEPADTTVEVTEVPAEGESSDAGEAAGDEAAPAEGEEEAADSPRPEDEAAAESEAESAEGDAAGDDAADESAAEPSDTTAESGDAAAEEGETAAAEGEADTAAAADEEEAVAETTTAEIPADGIHVVQPGETLYQIGLRYGYSWVVLAQFNNLANANSIKAGQELRIPPRPGDEAETDPLPTPEPNTTDETTYTVRPGDNLYLIGLIYGIDWPQIAEANGLVNPNRILVGQTLKIPADQPGDAPEFTHVVQRGETLFLIALRYGVTWTAIAEKNELEAPYVIYPDQTLIIPADS